MAASGDEFLSEEALAKGIEFKLSEEGLDFLIVPPLQSKILNRGLNRDVSYDGGKLAGESCLVSVLNDALLELAFKRIRIFQNSIYGPPFSDKFFGGLLSDSRNAGNVVRGISHETKDVDHLVGMFNLPEFFQRGEVYDLPFLTLSPRLPHDAVLRNELAEVLVRSDHECFEAALFLRLAGEGSDDVIGLVTVEFQNGDSEGLTEAFDAGKGRCKIFGHFLPVGFVCRIDLVAGRWCPCVKSNGQMRGFFALKNGKDRIRKTVKSGAVYPFRGIDGTPDKGEMRPICQCHTVKKEEPLHSRGSRPEVPRSTVSPNLTNRLK